MLAREAPDILCVQEAMPHMLADLRTWLPAHHLVTGSDARGERHAMSVLAARYDVLDRGTEPLPGNGTPRAATGVRLRERSTGAALPVVDTHLDHRSPEARIAAARKLRALFPGAVLAGDLNAEPGSEAFHILHEDRHDPFPVEGAQTMRGWSGPADARSDALLLPKDVAASAPRIVHGRERPSRARRGP